MLENASIFRQYRSPANRYSATLKIIYLSIFDNALSAAARSADWKRNRAARAVAVGTGRSKGRGGLARELFLVYCLGTRGARKRVPGCRRIHREAEIKT